MRNAVLAVRRWIYRNRLRITVLFLIVLALVVAFSNRIVVVVQSGQVGVKFSRLTGTEVGKVYDEGLQVMWPWDKMFLYDTRLQQRVDTIDMYAADGLQLHILLSTQFHIPRDQVARLQETVGPDYVRRIVQPDVIAAVRSVIGNYTEDNIYATDESGVLQSLQSTASHQSNAIRYDGIKIISLTLPDSIQRAIQYKIAEQQLARTQGYRIQTAQGEARRKAIEAQGYADFARISGIPALSLRQLEAAEAFAKSPNSKLILYGGGLGQTPLLLNGKQLP
ncbi:MAG TPA: prohibitin family protein [Gemmatimonadaceae bacterium]|nr:prohibitin family protein [Gemmatimonadaceae bacterium]